MKKCYLIIAILFSIVLSANGQRRRTPKPPKLTPEEQVRQAKLERMIPKTQQVMFIDSIVVDKQQFLRHYRLMPEVGHLASYHDFFQSNHQPNGYVYVNELGTRCYLSQEAPDSTINLYMSDNIDNHWTRPVALKGINNAGEFSRVNYPFMMGDGQTFYFAAEGEDGLGGYDIYATRFDTEKGHFLHPANIGMPFNSEANDYMYVVDEYSNLGWFATDRNQADNLVCIYIFEPTLTRKTYGSLGLDSEQILPYSRIDRITDTWSDSTAVANALNRLQKVSKKKKAPKIASDFMFTINDTLTYTRVSDFKADGNLQHFKQLTSLTNRYQRLMNTLERARDYYSTATPEERNELRPEILASEKEQHKLYIEIKNLQKKIRNQEIIFLTNH